MNNIKGSLLKIDIKNPIQIIHNPSYDELRIEESSDQLEGLEISYPTQFHCNNVLTGNFTGRSPKDKYIVRDKITKGSIWWDSKAYPNDNKPISNLIWNKLKIISTNQLSNKKLYVLDMFCGAKTDTRLSIRFVTEVAWQAHFVKNMFLEPTQDEVKNFKPDFHVLNSSKAVNPNWENHNLYSENFICFNFTERMQIIGGSWYGGEMKKGIFALMNFLLPQKNIASMHCSANSDQDGKNSSIFFGLSGTGKTTLSNDTKRYLVGDDEHGWDNQGIFNFEGGCYAKTSNLSPKTEPMIFEAIKENSLLENVKLNKKGNADFKNTTITKNGRVSYSMEHIEKRVGGRLVAEHPKNIIFLSADSTGVLPPLSCLTIEQAMYYYLSGYTSKTIGTEVGLNETQVTFSSCFGAAFLTLHPIKYAEVFEKKIREHNSKIYLINTGWNGKGDRLSLTKTRRLIHAINNNLINQNDLNILPIFNLNIPGSLIKKDALFFDPRLSFNSAEEWEKKALILSEKFSNNFNKFLGLKSELIKKYSSYGPNKPIN